MQPFVESFYLECLKKKSCNISDFCINYKFINKIMVIINFYPNRLISMKDQCNVTIAHIVLKEKIFTLIL